MTKKLLSLTLLIYILAVGCSEPKSKTEKVESLKDAYFNITYKLENNDKVEANYVKIISFSNKMNLNAKVYFNNVEWSLFNYMLKDNN